MMFDADANSIKGAKQPKHCLKTFTDFFERCKETATEQEIRAPNPL